MSLTMGERIRIVLKRKNMTLSDLAEELKMSRQNLNTKMKRDNFSQSDLNEIAEVLNVKYKSYFELEDGTEI